MGIFQLDLIDDINTEVHMHGFDREEYIEIALLYPSSYCVVPWRGFG